MPEKSDLVEIVTHCNQVMNSPYMRRQSPPELKNLRAVFESVRILTREDVPSLIAETKRLRSRNRKLEAEIDARQHPDAPSPPSCTDATAIDATTPT